MFYEDDVMVVEPRESNHWHFHNEVWERLEKKFNDHYGTDYQFDYLL